MNIVFQIKLQVKFSRLDQVRVCDDVSLNKCFLQLQNNYMEGTGKAIYFKVLQQRVSMNNVLKITNLSYGGPWDCHSIIGQS